jgi:uncharacterized SAM-binding protein YcdF (DUF218 family)
VTPLGRRRPRSATRRGLVGVAGVLLLVFVAVWLAAANRLIGHPRTDQPTRADAVIVLGPQDPQGGFALAQRLVSQGLVPNLLLSVSSGEGGPIGATCAGGPPRPTATVSCFVPNPFTTRGEARELARMVALHGWRTVIVITAPYHIERARKIFERCYTGRLEMVAPQIEISPLTWAYEYLYQTVGFAKASLENGC